MKSPANYIEYKSYLEAIATKHKLIEHCFYGYDDFNSKLQSSKTAIDGWCMVIEPYESKGKEPNSDNYMADRSGMLVICRKKQGALSKLAIEAAAEPIMQDIQSYFIDKYRMGESTIKFNNFSYSPIDPIFSASYCGLLLDFTFEVPQLSWIIEENWHPDTPEAP